MLRRIDRDNAGAGHSIIWKSNARPGDSRIVLLAFGVIVVLAGNMMGQVRLNMWNGVFFDASEKRNVVQFLSQFLMFFQIVAVVLALVVAKTWLQEMLKSDCASN